MDKEIKGYKDDSNEEKNTETNEKNDLIDKDIEKESETSNGDNNEIDKENQILNISIDKPIEFNKSKLENIEFESDEDLIEKEDIDINEDRIDKNKIKNKFKLTKKTRNIILIGSVIVLLLAINIGKTVSKYENKIFPGTLVYEQDISNLEKEELLSKLNKIEKSIEDNKVQININNKRYDIQFPGTLVYEQDISNLEKEELLSKLNKIEKSIEDNKVQININNKRYDIQIKNLVSKYNNEKLYKNIIKNQNEKNILSKFISIASKKNTNYNLYVEIDEKYFNDLKDEIAQDINIECIEPKVIINDDKISYKDGEDG